MYIYIISYYILYCVSWYQFIVFQYLPRFSGPSSWDWSPTGSDLSAHAGWRQRVRTATRQWWSWRWCHPRHSWRNFNQGIQGTRKTLTKHWWIKTCFWCFCSVFLSFNSRTKERRNNMEHGWARVPMASHVKPKLLELPASETPPSKSLGNLGTCWGKKRRKGTVRYNIHQYTSLLPLKHCYFGVNIFGQSLWHLNWCVDGPTGLQGPIPLSNTMQNANCCWIEWHLKISRDYRPGHHLREFSLGVAKFKFTVFREKKWCLTHPRYWNMYRFVWKWCKYLKSYGLLWWFPLGHHLPTNCNKDHGKES